MAFGDQAQDRMGPADDFRGLFARVEIFSLAGAYDRVAVCIARTPATATTASCVDAAPFCSMIMTLFDGELWPDARRRETSILEASAGGVVIWLFEASAGAQSVLSMLRDRGATILPPLHTAPADLARPEDMQ